MFKHINKLISLCVILLMVILIPGNLVLARSLAQEGAGGTTPAPTDIAPNTLVGTATPTATPQVYRALPPSAKTPIPETTETLSFSDFGLEEMVIRGPFGSGAYFFEFPATWSLKEGAELQLVLDILYTGDKIDSHDPIYGGTLLIQYNYVTIAALDINHGGAQTVTLPIPLDVLTRLSAGQSQSLQLILDSGINCDVNFRTTVIVRSTSRLHLPHDLIDPPLDLRLLPVPFFQDSFNKDSAIIVIPDQPTASELQAALAVSAGFGRMTFNRLLLSLVPASLVLPDMLKSTNLIFIGKPDTLNLMDQLALPLLPVNGKFATMNMLPSDGVIQMAISPWNDNKVVMIVSGNDDAAVVKAAQAVSTGVLRVGTSPSLSIVADVQPYLPAYDPADVNQTLDDLGYDSVVVGELGFNRVSYTFDVPQAYMLSPDAYLNLVFAHAVALDFHHSSILVKLNDQPIGSVQLDEGTATQGESKIRIPASAARPGSNQLDLDIVLEPSDECTNPALSGLWMRIDSASLLYLPFIPNPASASITLDLGKYPAPFAFDPAMSDLAFVLPSADPASWNTASQIAFALGNTNAIQVAGLTAFFADSVPDTARQERNLILVGRPSMLEILAELTNFLPAPFESGTDLAIEKNLQVSYRLGSGVDVGYLELLTSPWNDKRTILLVGGSSATGLEWAGNALLLGRFRSQLSGNLAFINGEQIVSADTRIFQGQGAMATILPSNLTPVMAELQPGIVERPAWLLPGIFISLGGIILVLFILGVQVVLRKRANR